MVSPVAVDTGQANLVCPDSRWKEYAFLHRTEGFDPFNMSSSGEDWRGYLLDKVVPRSGLSIAFLALVVATLLVLVLWRTSLTLVQCCMHCCGTCEQCGWRDDHGRHFVLGSFRLKAAKALMTLLAAAGIATAIVAMTQNPRVLVRSFWSSTQSMIDYGVGTDAQLTQFGGNFSSTLSLKLQEVYAFPTVYLPSQQIFSDLNCAGNFTAVRSNLEPAAALSNASTALYGVDINRLPAGTPVVLPIAGLQTTATAMANQLNVIASPAFLPALQTGLPALIGGRSFYDGVYQAANTYQDAVTALPSSRPPGGANAAVITTLANAQANMTLTAWNTQLDALDSALSAFVNSTSYTSLSQSMSANYSALQGVLSQLGAQLSDGHQYLPNASFAWNSSQSDCLNRAGIALAAIDQNVVDLGAEDGLGYVMFGTPVQVVSLLQALYRGGSRLFITGAESNIAPVLTAQIQLSAALASDTITYNNVLLPVANSLSSISGGAAVQDFQAAFRSGINGLTPSATNIAQALSDYTITPTASSYTILISAAQAGIRSIEGFTSTQPLLQSIQPTLDNLANLTSTLTLIQNATDPGSNLTGSLQSTLTQGVQSLLDAASPVQSLLDAAVQVNAGALALPSLNITATSNAKAYLDGLVGALQSPIALITTKADAVSNQLTNVVHVALNSSLIQLARDNQARWQGDSLQYEQYAHIVQESLLGAYILLVLLLLLSVLVNWPAGVMLLLLLLALMSVVLLAVGLLLAGGLFVLNDTCDSVESSVISSLQNNTAAPIAIPALNYTFNGKGDPPDGFLLEAFGLNVSMLTGQIEASKAELDLTGNYTVQPALKALLSDLFSIVDKNATTFRQLLQLADYSNLNPQYLDIKSVVCCQAGDAAYRQYYSWTACGMLAWGMCLLGAYILSQLDRVSNAGLCCDCSCLHDQGGSSEAYVFGVGGTSGRMPQVTTSAVHTPVSTATHQEIGKNNVGAFSNLAPPALRAGNMVKDVGSRASGGGGYYGDGTSLGRVSHLDGAGAFPMHPAEPHLYPPVPIAAPSRSGVSYATASSSLDGPRTPVPPHLGMDLYPAMPPGR